MSPLHGNPGGVARVCVRPPLRVNGDAHKRARGGAPLPIPARPLLPFSQPPPSRVPPPFVRDWGPKTGGCAPPPPGAPFAQKRLHDGGGAPPPAWFVRRPGPPFRTRRAQRGVPTPLPVRARTPVAHPLPIAHPFARRSCAQTRGEGKGGTAPGLHAPFARKRGQAAKGGASRAVPRSRKRVQGRGQKGGLSRADSRSRPVRA